MKFRLFLLALPFAFVACSEESAPQAKVERPAATYVIGALGEDNDNVYSGEIRARHETVLGFRIGGKIIERLVDVGENVNTGQVLARLDATDTGLQANAASAQLHLAREEVKRFRELRDQGFISQSALDAKETALKAAAAQAGLAQNQAAYTDLLSDRNGIIAATFAEVGQVVSAGQAIVRIAQDGAREVVMAIPESHMVSIKVGMKAEIELSTGAKNAKKYSGRLRELSPTADPVTRTYPAKVTLDDSDELVALGMTARVSIGHDRKNKGYHVPLTAIFQQGEKSAVWIVAQDRSVALRQVTVSNYQDNGALITNGLTAGERIISAGVHKIVAGEKIKPIENRVAAALPIVPDNKPKPVQPDIDLRIPDLDSVTTTKAESSNNQAPTAKKTITSNKLPNPKLSSTKLSSPKATENKPANKVNIEGYVAQIGAYSNADAAKRELGKLKKWGFIRAHTEKAGEMIRVRVGPYEDRDKAEMVGEMLEGHGLKPVILSTN